MSRDPFEELFGISGDDVPDEPAPISGRESAPTGQVDPVPTAPLPTRDSVPNTEVAAAAAASPAAGTTAAGTVASGGRESRAAQVKPWIIVGIIAVVAIIVSILIVNLARGGGEAQEPAPQPTSQQPTTPAPTEDADDADGDASADDEDDDEEPDPNEAPAVDPGPTNTLDIPQWGVSGELSSKFGQTSYRLENGNTEAVLSSALIAELPCEGNWGVRQDGQGGYEVLRPAERCEAAPELYDELWGLTDALVQSLG